jgi:luciferase family oxidoreductase group 1
MKLSVVDQSPVPSGSTAADALHNSIDLARLADRLGYARYWVAEHHATGAFASSAPEILIERVAAETSAIRVGSGGVMLPHYSPFKVAEVFRTLEALHPGRIDLGLGRAPGTDQATARALRRGGANAAETFPQDVQELQAYFHPAVPGQVVQAVPGAGLDVPIWILGSSLFGAQLAAALGLPYAFASHFAPDHLDRALAMYRREFQPSATLAKPYAMAAIGVIAAETDAAARRLATSLNQSFVLLLRGTPGPLPPPVDSMDGRWTPPEQAGVEHAFRESIVGSPDTVQRGLDAFLRRTGVDELMVTAAIHDHAARLKSFELIAQIRARM